MKNAPSDNTAVVRPVTSRHHAAASLFPRNQHDSSDDAEEEGAVASLSSSPPPPLPLPESHSCGSLECASGGQLESPSEAVASIMRGGSGAAFSCISIAGATPEGSDDDDPSAAPDSGACSTASSSARRCRTIIRSLASSASSSSTVIRFMRAYASSTLQFRLPSSGEGCSFDDGELVDWDPIRLRCFVFPFSFSLSLSLDPSRGDGTSEREPTASAWECSKTLRLGARIAAVVSRNCRIHSVETSGAAPGYDPTPRLSPPFPFLS
jgi:hypothetical protein